MSAPLPRIKSRTARENIMEIALQLADVSRKIVDACENRGPIAYDSPEYDNLVYESTDLQCDILSWVEWDGATPEERKAKAKAAAKKKAEAQPST